MPSTSKNIQTATALLQQTSSSPALDASCLLCHLLQKPRSFLFAHPEYELSDAEQSIFDLLIYQRSEGMPVAYLTGEKEFYGLDFAVTPDVLIPRPDTETLIETVLDTFEPAEAKKVLDLGTGSGAIAVTLAKHCPMWSVTATDMSAPALDVATQNAAAHDCNNITFCEGSWFDAVSHQKFNLIISNPPYIAEHDENLKGDIRHEPTTALTSGADGLDDIKHIVKLAPTFLEKNGTLILEHGFDQGDAVAAWLKQAGFENVGHQKDIQGIVRITFGQLAQNG